jgi:hypothetical protein
VPASDGALFVPVPDGLGVRGGWGGPERAAAGRVALAAGALLAGALAMSALAALAGGSRRHA